MSVDDTPARAVGSDAPSQGEWVGAVRGLLLTADRVWQSLAAQAGMGLTDLITLEQLHAAEHQVTVAQVRQRTGLTAAAVTALIDRLVNRGLAQRGRSGTDRRVVLIELTAAGRKTSDALFAPAIELLVQGQEDLDLPELAVRVRCVAYTATLLDRVADRALGCPTASPRQ